MRQNTIHQSLQMKKLIAGIDDRLFMFIWTVSLGMALLYGFVLMIFAAIVAHLFLRWVFKGDENALEIYLAYREEVDVYDPWPRVDTDNKRPQGFGRDLLC